MRGCLLVVEKVLVPFQVRKRAYPFKSLKVLQKGKRGKRAFIAKW